MRYGNFSPVRILFVISLIPLSERDIKSKITKAVCMAANDDWMACRRLSLILISKKFFLLLQKDGFDTLFQQKVELFGIIA